MSDDMFLFKKRFFVSFFFFGFKRLELRSAQKNFAQIHLIERGGASTVEMTLYEDWFYRLMPEKLIEQGAKSKEIFFIDIFFEKIEIPTYTSGLKKPDVAEINSQFFLKRMALSILDEYNTELSVEEYGVGRKKDSRILDLLLHRENSRAEDSFTGKIFLDESEFETVKAVPRNVLFRPVFSIGTLIL